MKYVSLVIAVMYGVPDETLLVYAPVINTNQNKTKQKKTQVFEERRASPAKIQKCEGQTDGWTEGGDRRTDNGNVVPVCQLANVNVTEVKKNTRLRFM